MPRRLDGATGVVRSRARDNWDSASRLINHDLDYAAAFVLGHRGRFAGGAAGHEPMNAIGNLKLDEGSKSRLVDLLVSERGDQRGERAGELHSHVFAAPSGIARP